MHVPHYSSQGAVSFLYMGFRTGHSICIILIFFQTLVSGVIYIFSCNPIYKQENAYGFFLVVIVKDDPPQHSTHDK